MSYEWQQLVAKLHTGRLNPGEEFDLGQNVSEEQLRRVVKSLSNEVAEHVVWAWGLKYLNGLSLSYLLSALNAEYGKRSPKEELWRHEMVIGRLRRDTWLVANGFAVPSRPEDETE